MVSLVKDGHDVGVFWILRLTFRFGGRVPGWSSMLDCAEKRGNGQKKSQEETLSSKKNKNKKTEQKIRTQGRGKGGGKGKEREKRFLLSNGLDSELFGVVKR